MRRPIAVITLAAALFGVTAIAAMAGPPMEATVQFGNEDVGSGLNDPGAGVFHDSSFKANDKIRPHTVVISAGGTVDFQVAGFHQVAVCGEGIELADVTIPEFPPNLMINDADCPAAAGLFESTSVTFNEPGQYLILCNITPHVVEAGMYSYVRVK